MSSEKVLAAKVGTLVSTIGFLKIKTIIMSASILASIIDKKITKTKAGFLVDWDIYLHNAFFYHNYSM